MIKWGLFQVCKAKIKINVSYDINRLTKKKHTIIAIDAEKAFGKIQQLFMIQKQQQNSHTRNREHPQLDKQYLQKPVANIIFNNGERSPTNINKLRIPPLTSSTHHDTVRPS